MALPASQDPHPARRRMLPKQSQVFFFIILAFFLWLTWLIFEAFLIYIITGIFVAVLALPLDKFWERFFRNKMAAGFTMVSIFLLLTVPLVVLGFSMANDVQKLAAEAGGCPGVGRDREPDQQHGAQALGRQGRPRPRAGPQRHGAPGLRVGAGVRRP
jgi:hypothetical protein